MSTSTSTENNYEDNHELKHTFNWLLNRVVLISSTINSIGLKIVTTNIQTLAYIEIFQMKVATNIQTVLG